MSSVKDIHIQDYAYDLPDDLIPKYAKVDRDHSRLLVWENGRITDDHFFNLPELLPQNSLLVFNNTKVIRARLLFRKATGAKIEIFCLEPIDPSEYVLSFSQQQQCTWKCMVGNLKKWKGEKLVQNLKIGKEQLNFCAEKIGDLSNGCEVAFSWDNPTYSFAEILEASGNIPIPPYLNRESEDIDITSYQTVYSRISGSVAAPTAGLHFTHELFSALDRNHVLCEEVTLHVGAGTFQPVKSDKIGGHEMHSEHFVVTRSLIETLSTFKGKIIAVGTTSVRTLESLYFIGCKISLNPGIKIPELSVNQWEPYQSEENDLSLNRSLGAIIEYMKLHDLTELNTSTQIIIAPGYRFKVISGMITNFHQPLSTLLLLIAAFLGEDWKQIYEHALNNKYRFLSYGDSNLYLK